MNAPASLPAKSGDLVTVGCKLPHGLYLDLYAEGRPPEGSAPEVIARVKVNGANSSEIIGGHGITFGVPKEHWDAWMRENKNKPFVKNGLIFAQGKIEAARSEAAEKATNRSGFEGLNPERDKTLGVVKGDEQGPALSPEQIARTLRVNA